MKTDYEVRPKIGLYQHFKGSYYFLYNLLKDTINSGKYVCEYFNVLHPELGHFARPEDQWFTDVSEREDNVTGQGTRFQIVKSIDTSMVNFTTDQLMRELSMRRDSPLQALDIEGVSSMVVCHDFVLGEVCTFPDTENTGVRTLIAFDNEAEAKKYYETHTTIPVQKVFKRTFLAVD